MALLNQSVQVYGKLGSLFEKLRDGQAPEKFTREFLKDLGFASSNWHASIGLLKGLGFLSPDGTPTGQYMEFLDKTRWDKVLGSAVKSAYSDIFVMKREPSQADIQMIAGKYKSTYNMSQTSADRAARTFLALLELADLSAPESIPKTETSIEAEEQQPEPQVTLEPKADEIPRPGLPVGLNYNIQIHLPATKDIEVYNAIFKSLREHIID